MTVFELGAIGEFIGALLLFVSLFYVGIQIRHNTKVSRAQSQRSSADQFTNVDLVITGNPELRAVLVAMNDGTKLADLDIDARIRTNAVLQAYVNTFSSVYFEYTNGVVDEKSWRQYEVIIKSALVPNAMFRDWWRTRASADSLYGGEFFAWVSKQVEEFERTHEGDDS